METGTQEGTAGGGKRNKGKGKSQKEMYSTEENRDIPVLSTDFNSMAAHAGRRYNIV
jgi:hypothetical protein